MKNNDTHIPKLDLFLDVNTPHLEKFSRLLGKELGMRESTQFKALRVLLCSMFTQGQRQVRVSRRKKSLGGKKLNPLDIKYNSVNGALDKLEANDYIIQILGSHNDYGAY